MSEAGQNLSDAGSGHSLPEAIREVKNAQADRDDVVVEMREASRTRLELLAQELVPVFADVPEDDPRFDLAISSGAQPRLWIDAVAHVTMGRDRRTYRFLRDTRMGRTVLAESTDIAPVAGQVTRYIAERMVERQQMVEGDVEMLQRGQAGEEAAPDSGGGIRWKQVFSGALLVIAGGAVGVAAMLVYLAERYPELGIDLPGLF